MKSRAFSSRTVAFGALFGSLAACGPKDASSASSIDVTYALARRYVGTPTNALGISLGEGMADGYLFSVESTSATPSVSAGTFHKLTAQDVGLAFTSEGVHGVELRVKKPNGTPYLHDVLFWEYSTELPQEPTVSFSMQATRFLTNNLVVSDTRTASTSEIWLGGDVATTGRIGVVDGGYWQDLATDTVAVSVTLTSGDGVKRVENKFRNLFGNEGPRGYPAEIILKQTPPTNCSAQVKSRYAGGGLVSVKLTATDPYPVYFSALGDLTAAVDQTAFVSGNSVSLRVPPVAGTKRFSIVIQDIAGNVCLDETFEVIFDPNIESEAIVVQSGNYWTDTEDVVVDVTFDHFADQEPLQIKITGDATGASVGTWLDDATGVPVRLTAGTGPRTIYAQYRDVNGVESHLIARRLFLRPGVTVVPAGGGGRTVYVSAMTGLASLSIAGCNESYVDVGYQAGYPCTPNAASIDVTYLFADGSTLVRSAPP